METAVVRAGCGGLCRRRRSRAARTNGVTWVGALMVIVVVWAAPVSRRVKVAPSKE